MTAPPDSSTSRSTGAGVTTSPPIPSTIWEVGHRLPETGVTAFLPTIVSAPYEFVDAAVEVMKAGPPVGYDGAEPSGLHVEGPWISPEWKGAHNPDHLRLPDVGVARTLGRLGCGAGW